MESIDNIENIENINNPKNFFTSPESSFKNNKGFQICLLYFYTEIIFY